MLAILLAPAVALAQGNAKEIMAKPAAELVEILKNPRATTFEKAKACQRLAVVGTKDAVPALAALLPDEKLNLYARTALENIPGPEVDAALREATKTLKGRPLVGVIDSIGQRRDAMAVELLAKYLLDDKDPAVASAAAGALGRIGTLEAAAILIHPDIDESSAAKYPAADALLAAVEQLATSESRKLTEDEAAMIAALAGHNPDFRVNLSKHIRVAALCELFRHATFEEDWVKDLLMSKIGDSDKAFFNVGLIASREIPGKDVTEALVGELEKLPPERRALLLLALADRKDKPELAVLVRESKNESEEVRKAAVYALTQRADADAAKTMIDIALGEGPVAEAAKVGLVTIPGEGIDATIIEKYGKYAKFASTDERAKIVLLDLFGDRRIVAAIPMVRAALGDASLPIRLAALTAMAKLIDVGDLDVLIGPALASDKPKEETAAAKAALDLAVLRMGDRDATAGKIAEHIQNAAPDGRSYLYDLLRRVSGKKALEAVVAGTKSADAAQKDAATRVLGEWVNTDAAPALLEIAKSDPEKKYQIRALRGYIRIARQLEIPWWEASNAPAVKLKMYDASMAAAGRSDEKLLALDILTRIPSAETLSRAAACLADPELKEKAAAVTVDIAGKVIGGNPKAVADAMRTVLDAKIEGKTADQARQLLERAGGK